MLKSCTKSEFDIYVDFAYELAMIPEKSAYPTYCDGAKTKEMFMERLEKAFERETEEILLFEYEGKVEGIIHYYWIPEDHYVGTDCFNINKMTEQAISEFLTFVGDKLKGYDLFMGFPAENSSAVKFFEKQGYECIEDDYNNIAFLDGMKDLPNCNNLIRITKDNYESFKILHDQIEGDMYWNSERIFADLDNWIVYVEETDGVPRGAVYYIDESDDWFEIFGIDLSNGKFNREVFKDLLYAAMSDVKNKGGKVLTFFCEEEGEQATLECGFTCVGRYRCYKAYLV